MKIIAFGHRARVGKDTAARFLVSYLRTAMRVQHVQSASFATKMKQQTHELYFWAGLKDEAYYEQNPEEKEIVLPAIGLSPRQIWVKFGTLVAREVFPGTWNSYVYEHAKAHNYSHLIIRDLRFVDEADLILEKGGEVYRIDRPGYDGKNDDPIKAIADAPLANYARWTGIIQNDSDLKSFHTKVIAIVGGIKHGLAS